MRLDLEEHKSTYSLEHIAAMFPEPSEDDEEESEPPRAKRQRKLPSYLKDSVITAPMPQFRSTQDVTELRALAVDIIESFKSELDGRFSGENVKLWKALQALSPDHNEEEFLNYKLLIPLLEYCYTIPYFKGIMGELGDAKETLKSECRIFKRLFLIQWSLISPDDKLRTTEILTQYSQTLTAAKIIHILFKFAMIAGYSTATVECAFSARKRIDTDHRRRLTPYKQGNLTLLHFEKKLTKSVSFDEFLEMWKLKPRRLRV